MADLFNSGSSEKTPFEVLCKIYVLYFDEARGHIPLLIFPRDAEKLKDDKKYMRPIKYHSIWFLSVEEQGALDHIDLEYKGFTFFGKKFLTKSKRKKRRAGLEEETPETIVVIVSLPTDLEIFGDELIRKLTQEIQDKFDEKIFEIIEAEVAKDEVIKSPKIKNCIEKGQKIKENLTELITNVTNEYFSKAIKQTDATSIKKQKAISYLFLKGIDVSHISSNETDAAFSSIKLFDPREKNEKLKIDAPLTISSINVIEDSQEIEILLQNNTDKELNNISVTITHIKEFFEKEIMHQNINFWFPNEELLFISPIIPEINEYLIFIIDENINKKLLTKRIDLNILNKIKS